MTVLLDEACASRLIDMDDALGAVEEVFTEASPAAQDRFEGSRAHFTTPEMVEIVTRVGITEPADPLGAVLGLEPDRSESP